MTETGTYLLDTTVLIDVLKRREPVRSWLEATVASTATVAVFAVSVAETVARTDARDRSITGTFLRSLAVWPVTPDTAFEAGVLRYDHARRGVSLHTADALLAATALAVAAVLVTSNVRDFQGLGVPVLDVGG